MQNLIHVRAEITCPFCDGLGKIEVENLLEECGKCGGHKMLRKRIPCYIGFGNTLVVDSDWLFEHPTIEKV